MLPSIDFVMLPKTFTAMFKDLFSCARAARDFNGWIVSWISGLALDVDGSVLFEGVCVDVYGLLVLPGASWFEVEGGFVGRMEVLSFI